MHCCLLPTAPSPHHHYRQHSEKPLTATSSCAGIRNAAGFQFHPASGDLLFSGMERDYMGNNSVSFSYCIGLACLAGSAPKAGPAGNAVAVAPGLKRA